MESMAWYDFLSRLTEKAGGTGKLVIIIVVCGIVLALLINVGYVFARRRGRFLQELDRDPSQDRDPVSGRETTADRENDDWNGGGDE